MAINIDTLMQLRDRSIKDSFVFLITLEDRQERLIRNFTDFTEDINISAETTLYKSLPFIVAFPNFNSTPGKRINMMFPNYESKNSANLQEELLNTHKVTMQFINSKFTSDRIFPQAIYYSSAGDSFSKDEQTMTVSFSRKILEDAKYPYRVYNNVDHPTLLDKDQYGPIIVK